MFIWVFQVTEFSRENKMSASNLAVVFGPNLIRPCNETNASLAEITCRQSAINNFTEYLITNCQAIFISAADGESSVTKHSCLEDLNKEDDMSCVYQTELDGNVGFIPSNYIDMKPYSWYYGHITRADAEKLLSNQHEGAFVVRLSESFGKLGNLSLSVNCGDGVQHFKILRDAHGKLFLWMIKFNSLDELIEYYHSASVSWSQDIKLKELAPEEFLV